MPETIEVGEQLYQMTLQITSIQDFGVTLDEIGPDKPIPSTGARFDIAVEGEATGKLSGTMKAVDYVMIRADGLSQLHVHGALETPDGARIALSARGTSVPNTTTGESDIRLNAELHTTSPDYAWLNTTAVWVKGTASMITGQLLLTGYAA